MKKGVKRNKYRIVMNPFVFYSLSKLTNDVYGGAKSRAESSLGTLVLNNSASAGCIKKQ